MATAQGTLKSAKQFTGTQTDQIQSFGQNYLAEAKKYDKNGLRSQIETICDLYNLDRKDIYDNDFKNSGIMGIKGLANVYDGLPTYKEKWSSMIYSADHEMLLQILYLVYDKAGIDKKKAYPRIGRKYEEFGSVTVTVGTSAGPPGSTGPTPQENYDKIKQKLQQGIVQTGIKQQLKALDFNVLTASLSQANFGDDVIRVVRIYLHHTAGLTFVSANNNDTQKEAHVWAQLAGKQAEYDNLIKPLITNAINEVRTEMINKNYNQIEAYLRNNAIKGEIKNDLVANNSLDMLIASRAQQPNFGVSVREAVSVNLLNNGLSYILTTTSLSPSTDTKKQPHEWAQLANKEPEYNNLVEIILDEAINQARDKENMQKYDQIKSKLQDKIIKDRIAERLLPGQTIITLDTIKHQGAIGFGPVVIPIIDNELIASGLTFIGPANTLTEKHAHQWAQLVHKSPEYINIVKGIIEIAILILTRARGIFNLIRNQLKDNSVKQAIKNALKTGNTRAELQAFKTQQPHFGSTVIGIVQTELINKGIPQLGTGGTNRRAHEWADLNGKSGEYKNLVETILDEAITELVPTGPPPPPPIGQKLKMISYNVLWKVTNDMMHTACGHANPNTCIRNIAQIIDSKGQLDFVAFQEITNVKKVINISNELKRMIGGSANNYVGDVSKKAGDHTRADGNDKDNLLITLTKAFRAGPGHVVSICGAESMATFWDSSKYHLDGTPTVGCITLDRANNDYRPFQVIKLREGIVLINVHPGHLVGAPARPDWQNIPEKVFDIVSDLTHCDRIIMAGDFNADIKTNAIQVPGTRLKRDTGDNSLTINDKIKMYYSPNTFNTCCYNDNVTANLGPGDPKNMNIGHYDHILDTAGTPDLQKLTPTTPASDHLPVYAELQPFSKVEKRYLVYLAPSDAGQTNMQSIKPLANNTFVNRWGGYHITLGKGFSGTEADAKRMFYRLDNLGQGKWKFGNSRAANLQDSSSGEKREIMFTSGLTTKAIAILKNMGWGSVTSTVHFTLGKKDEVSDKENQLLTAIKNDNDSWQFVLVEDDGTQAKWICKINATSVDQIEASLMADIIAHRSVKGKFYKLLYSHATYIPTFLKMLRGVYTFIKCCHPTQPPPPVGQPNLGGKYNYGAQFRYGMDSLYGDIKLIMKPDFWRKYRKGVYPVPPQSQWGPGRNIIKHFPQFVSFFHHPIYEGTEDRKATVYYLITLAQNYDFRAINYQNRLSIPGRDYFDQGGSNQKSFQLSDFIMSQYRVDRDPPTTFHASWGNIQLHIGENVTFDDIMFVLVPKFLIEDKATGSDPNIKVKITKPGGGVENFPSIRQLLQDGNTNDLLPDGVTPNPWKGKLIFVDSGTPSEYYGYLDSSVYNSGGKVNDPDIRYLYDDIRNKYFVPSGTYPPNNKDSARARDPTVVRGNGAYEISASRDAFRKEQEEYFKKMVEINYYLPTGVSKLSFNDIHKFKYM